MQLITGLLFIRVHGLITAVFIEIGKSGNLNIKIHHDNIVNPKAVNHRTGFITNIWLDNRNFYGNR